MTPKGHAVKPKYHFSIAAAVTAVAVTAVAAAAAAAAAVGGYRRLPRLAPLGEIYPWLYTIDIACIAERHASVSFSDLVFGS